MQSSPNRSESASTTTRPSPWAAATISGRLRDRRSGVGAREHGRAVRRRDGRRAVQAGLAHAREQIAGASAGARLQVGQDPARRVTVVLVVLDGVVLQVQSKRASSSLRLLPYFSCSVSPSTISPPPADTNASIASSSSPLSRGEPVPVVRSQAGSDGCAMTSTLAPAQGVRSQRLIHVRRDHEVALGQHGGRASVRGVAGVSGLHLARELGTDRPRLAVRLVEDDTGKRS